MSWHKQAKKWSAQIEHGGRQEKLGLFATEEEAKAAHSARCLELGVEMDHDAVEELVASASRRKAAPEVKLKRHRIGPESGPTSGLY